MKSFEDIALEKLKEIAYKTPNAFYHTLKKLVRSNRVIEKTDKKPYLYYVNQKGA